MFYAAYRPYTRYRYDFHPGVINPRVGTKGLKMFTFVFSGAHIAGERQYFRCFGIQHFQHICLRRHTNALHTATTTPGHVDKDARNLESSHKILRQTVNDVQYTPGGYIRRLYENGCNTPLQSKRYEEAFALTSQPP